MRNRDMPAAPTDPQDAVDFTGKPYAEHQGLTKRESAAIAALQGLLAGEGARKVSVADAMGITRSQAYVQEAVDYADALFNELEKEDKG